MRAPSLDFLKTLIDTPSPSGAEGPVARLYRDEAARYADRVTTDVHGNVTAVINPDAPMKIMLAAHMDEIGFVIHHIGEAGLLHFSVIGGHDSTIPAGQMVWVHGRQRVAGAVGHKAIHLLTGDERQRKPPMREMWIDIGATSRAEAEAVVQVGDIVTYQYEFQRLLGDRAAARAFDNKAGLFIVAETLRLLREEEGLHPGVAVHAVGTVQEEIGSRGARTAAFGIGAQTGLAVDMDHAMDYPGVDAAQIGQIELGKGPTILRGANTNPVVYRLLCETARKEGIAFQVRVAPGGTPTDANAMQLSGPGMAAGLLAIPLRYMHTPCEVLSLQDVADCARLMAAYCRYISPQTDFTPW